jgi:hypothetical protein
MQGMADQEKGFFHISLFCMQDGVAEKPEKNNGFSFLLFPCSAWERTMDALRPIPRFIIQRAAAIQNLQ